MENNTQNIEKKNKDTYSYKGWLNSDSFVKRALAIVGYNFVGTLILYLIILIIALIIGIILGLVGGLK